MSGDPSWQRCSWHPPARAVTASGSWVEGGGMPIAVADGHGCWMVIVTGRDERGRGHLLLGRMEGRHWPESLADSWRVVMAPGPPGAFDESGVVASDIRVLDDGFEVLFHGYRLRSGGGWWNAIGHARLDGDGYVRDRSAAPIIGLSAACPISVAYGSWDPDRPSDIWFNSAEGLDPETALPRRYVVRRLVDECVVAVDVDMPGDVFALTRPVVASLDGKRRLLFCMRGPEYIVGSLELDSSSSPTGTITPFPPLGRGGEVHATAYPYVVRGPADPFLLYSGDGYGRTGFGVARWTSLTER